MLSEKRENSQKVLRRLSQGSGRRIGGRLAGGERAHRVAQVVAADRKEDEIRAGGPFLDGRVFHLSKKIPSLRSIDREVFHGNRAPLHPERGRDALRVSAAARRVARAARQRITERDDAKVAVCSRDGRWRSRDRRSGRIDGLAEVPLKRRGEAGGENAGGRETEGRGEKPEQKTAGGACHGAVFCRKRKRA